MLALRSLARSVPRATTQFTARSVPRQSSILSRIQRQPTFSPLSRFAAPFSSSRWRAAPDEELTIKLDQELKIEQDLVTSPDSTAAQTKASFDNFLSKSGWAIEDKPGVEEIVLTKQYNNETIRVIFSIADINNESPYSEEQPYSEEDSPSSLRTAPEDQIEDPTPEQEEDYPPPSYSIKLSMQVSKPGQPGALLIEALTENSRVVIDEFWFVKDKALLEPKTYEAERVRGDTYFGPSFSNLDEELQALVENYVAERGLNEELAGFATEYIDWKEQREYISWLENVKNFTAE